MFMYITGCFGHPLILRGSTGRFGISATQYQHSLMCNWTIQVEATKVYNNNIAQNGC